MSTFATVFAFILALAVPSGYAQEAPTTDVPDPMVVADFDSGRKPNNVGG